MRPITGKELCRRLGEAGWNLKRIHGSHHIFGKAANGKSLVSLFTEIKTSNRGWPLELPGCRNCMVIFLEGP
jgi:predicted RNA binding protein YcfA (HicA-like mRNA interferase family)